MPGYPGFHGGLHDGFVRVLYLAVPRPNDAPNVGGLNNKPAVGVVAHCKPNGAVGVFRSK
jgi:hypothetical protein